MIILVLSRFFFYHMCSLYSQSVELVLRFGVFCCYCWWFVCFFFSQISLKFCSFNKGKLGIVRPFSFFFFSYIKLSVPCLGFVDRIDKGQERKLKFFKLGIGSINGYFV